VDIAPSDAVRIAPYTADARQRAPTNHGAHPGMITTLTAVLAIIRWRIPERRAKTLTPPLSGVFMPTPKQKTAARRNVKKAAAAAKSKKTISHLSKATRTALGKQGAKVAQAQRSQH